MDKLTQTRAVYRASEQGSPSVPLLSTWPRDRIQNGGSGRDVHKDKFLAVPFRRVKNWKQPPGLAEGAQLDEFPHIPQLEISYH